jgi:PAS domain-containing protein
VIGLPAPGCEIKLVPSGGKLEARVRGPNVTPGYYKRDDLTRAAFDDEGFYCIGDALRLAGPRAALRSAWSSTDASAEDFKLLSGTWVHVGAVRVKLIAAANPVLQDAVLTGHDRDEVGALVFLNPATTKDMAAEAVRARIAGALRAMAGEGGSSMHPTRALVMSEPASIDANEITDKGYINQRAVLERRAALVAAPACESPASGCRDGQGLRMTAPDSSADPRQTAERVRLLYEFSPGGYLLSVAVAIATVVFLWGEVSRPVLLGWIVAVLIICAGRYALYLAHDARAPEIEEASAWERYFIVGATLMGIAWAALPVLLFPERGIEAQLALIFIVAAMAMGGVGILAPSPLALLFFLAPMTLAMIARLLMQEGQILVGMGVVAIFYVGLLARIGREFHRALTDAIGSRVVNEGLIERLRQSQDALSDAIESLPEAIAIYDADDRMVLCNRKYAQAQTTFDDPAQLVGKSFAELVRLSVAKGEAIEPEYAGDVEAWVAERIRRREAEAGKEPRMYRIGDGRWMLTSISRARAGGIIAVRTDITRLREAEISLKSALDEQELIFEGVTAGIAFVRDRVTQRVNGRLAEMFGYRARK